MTLIYTWKNQFLFSLRLFFLYNIRSMVNYWFDSIEERVSQFPHMQKTRNQCLYIIYRVRIHSSFVFLIKYCSYGSPMLVIIIIITSPKSNYTVVNTYMANARENTTVWNKEEKKCQARVQFICKFVFAAAFVERVVYRCHRSVLRFVFSDTSSVRINIILYYNTRHPARSVTVYGYVIRSDSHNAAVAAAEIDARTATI